jgi:methyltransferase of ATP-grasp peptide maturase system
MTTDDAALRSAVVERLGAGGHLRTEPWRKAAEAVPRHEFLRTGFFEQLTGSGPTAWRPVMPDDEGWLTSCYEDESLVTQIAGAIVPSDIRGRIMRAPTSSSTLPSLVLRMLEDLQVEDGRTVLEIGTGTGYSTALLSHRLGSGAVTSVEVDPEVSARAATALRATGFDPHLVVGDGLLGHGPRGPYDRLIATCGVVDVPAAWLDQVRPGGIILATLSGWLYSSELARLTVGADGTARGSFLGGQVSFMLARPQLPPPLGVLPDLGGGTERLVDVGPDALEDWATRFVAQLAVPRAQRLSLERDGVTETVLVDVEAGSWAAVRPTGRTWTVRQGGPEMLWDAVEDGVGRYRRDGSPDLSRFDIAMSPDGVSIAWPGDGPQW